jgi:hypothetical protein
MGLFSKIALIRFWKGVEGCPLTLCSKYGKRVEEESGSDSDSGVHLI